MSIFDALGRQQRLLEELVEDALTQAEAGKTELAFVTFQLLSNKLVACMQAEHATVYPRLEREAGLVNEVAQARREHEAMEDTITRLRIGGLPADEWRTELAHLANMMEQHASLEEFTLFPIAALTFTQEQLADIGQQFMTALLVATSVADAAITYSTAEFEPPAALVVRFKAA